MKLAFLGTGAFGVATLEALCRAGHELTCVLSQPDRPSGRGRRVVPTPIHQAAQRLGLPHAQAEDVNALDPSAALAGAALGVVVAFGQKIGPRWLAAPPLGLVNLHASLLPRHRGAAPYQWAILSGDCETGVTVFRLNERWDDGPILGQRRTPIAPTETADELHDRLAPLGAELVVEVASQLAAGTCVPQPQDRALATRAPKLRKCDGWIDWGESAERVVRRIHGLWSWPGAVCQCPDGRGGRCELRLVRACVVAASVLDEDASRANATAKPGTILPDLSIQAGSGRVRLLEVQPAGRKRMTFEAFVCGRSLSPGERLTRYGPDAA